MSQEICYYFLLPSVIVVILACCPGSADMAVERPTSNISDRPETGDYAGSCVNPLREVWVLPGSYVQFLSPGFPEKNFTYDYFCGWTFLALNGLLMDLACTATLGVDDYLVFYDDSGNNTESVDNLHEGQVTRRFKGSSVSVWLDSVYYGQERLVDCYIWTYNPAPLHSEASTSWPSLQTSLAPSSTCMCGELLESSSAAGGVETVPGFKWMATLALSFSNQFCAGTLISDGWIVTAAHCVAKFYEGGSGRKLSVGLGLNSLSSPLSSSTSRTVRQAIIHPLYNAATLANDIALLRVDPISWEVHDAIRPACLPNDPSDLYEGNTGIAVRWDSISTDGAVPHNLQEVSLPIISNSVCQTKMKNYITEAMMCATSPEDAPCTGDSGGPLLVMEGSNAVLVGVLSRGSSYSQVSRTSVFSRVTEFLPWIEETTLGTEFCPRA